MSKQTAEIICAALLAIVSALRKQYGLTDRNNVQIVIAQKCDIMPEVE